ncbi:MAG: hypothetical protein ABIJ09_01435 [Pseudomonadota bacterium]
MGLTQLLIFFASLSLIAAGVMFFWWRRDLTRLTGLSDERSDLQSKLEASRSELGALKEENRKRRAELVEARDQVRKLKRKRGRGDDEGEAEAGPQNAEVERLKDEVKKLNNALQGAEARVQRVQDEARAATEAARHEAEAQSRKEAGAGLRELEDKAAKLEDTIRRLERDLEASRAQTAQARSESTPPDLRIALDALPAEVVDELRRFYKRASNNEKLHLLARGKLEAVSDKLDEITRRYQAVCRELALAAGRQVAEGEEGERQAEHIAQDIVSASEELMHRRRRRPRPRRAEREDGSTREGGDDTGDGAGPDQESAAGSSAAQAAAPELAVEQSSSGEAPPAASAQVADTADATAAEMASTGDTGGLDVDAKDPEEDSKPSAGSVG